MSVTRHEQALEALRQKQQAAERDPRLTTAPVYCNASQTENYVPPVWNIRAGAGERSKNGRCA